MKSRFIMFRRGSVFYAEETATGKQTSLRTKDEAEALTLLNTKNEATRQPAMNLQIAQVYLQHADPTMAQRTWQNVMDAMFPLKTGPTQARWQAAMRDKAYDLIRSRKLIETGSEHFLQVLNAGTISTNMFLRRLHNFAIGMHWLPWPVLPRLKWPAVEHKERRAITAEEHRIITEREHNPEIRAYYQLLWHLGGSQTDIAELTAEDIDWKDRTISYHRRKTAVPVVKGDSGDKDRADFFCIAVGGTLHIVEIKRGAFEAKEKDILQADKYRQYTLKRFEQLTDPKAIKYGHVQSHLIAATLHDDAKNIKTAYADKGWVFFTTWDDLIERAKQSHNQFREILEKRAAEGAVDSESGTDTDKNGHGSKKKSTRKSNKRNVHKKRKQK